MTKIKKNKKIWKFAAISFFGILPIFLASCSAPASLVSKTVSKDQGLSLDSNTSLTDYSLAALKSDTGMKAYLSGITHELIFKWLEKLSKTTNINFKNSFNNQKTVIDNDYDNLVEKYKKDYKEDWALKFQQEVLDTAGGTEQAYKQSKWNAWALSQFETYLFNKSYLTYKKADGTIFNPSNIANVNDKDLYSALENKNLVFAYPNNSKDSTVLTTDLIDATYADFIQFIWNQYVQVVNPYVVNMSLWKYGTPSQGMSSLYNGVESTVTTPKDDGSGGQNPATQIPQNSKVKMNFKDTIAPDPSAPSTGTGQEGEGEGESTTTAAAASYVYPYFGNDAVGSTTGTLSKFVGFVNQANSATQTDVKLPGATNSVKATIPFISSFDANGYGLLNIPNNYTDDSSTFILAKNNSIYTDLYIEFAAASSYLFWRSSNIKDDVNFTNDEKASANGIPSIDGNIKKDLDNNISINSDATTGLDTITKEFVGQNQFFTNGAEYQIKLDKSYVNKLISPNGPISKLRDKDLYTIDSFIPSNKNLTNYMLLRNSAGVHAITIDGYNYINGSVNADSTLTATEKKQRAGQVVLFRSLYDKLNSKQTNYSFAVDVQSELKTFYSNNLDWLVYLYASSKPDNLLFNLNDLKLSESEKNAANAINNFLHEISFYKKVDEYNQALNKGINTYSLSYGTVVYENGLAAPWIYKSFTANDSKLYDSNRNISFQIAATVSTSYNPFTETSRDGSKNFDGSSFISKSILDSNLSNLVNAIQQLNSDFEGFKYSQIIYSSSSYVNVALLAYSNEGTNLTNLSQMNYLKKYIGNFFNFETLKFNTYNVSYNSSSVDISTYLNYALSNFFFNSPFDSAEVKWLKLGNDDSNKWDNVILGKTQAGDTTDVNQILQDYKLKLWKSENLVLSSTAINNYLSLYTTVAATKYMVENNFDYFLTHMSSLVTNGENAYVVWQNSENKALEQNKNKNNTASGLMDASKINRNINNNYFSSYIGGYNIYANSTPTTPTPTPGSTTPTTPAATTATPLTVNYQEELSNTSWTNNLNPNIGIYSSYQDANLSNVYYSVSSKMTGFLGLQTKDSNNLNDIISNRLFVNPTIDNSDLTGILYGYGKNLETVIKVIQNTPTVSGINSIATDLADKLKQNQLKEIADNKTISLKEKKEKLVTAVTNLSSNLSSTGVFSQRKGILNEKALTESNHNGLIFEPTKPFVQFASYVVQISRYDLLSLNSLLGALEIDSNKNNNALDVLSNLVIQQATNLDSQKKIVSLLLVEHGKIKAYDVRLYTGLGVEWISGWKVTNPIAPSGGSSTAPDAGGAGGDPGTGTTPTPDAGGNSPVTVS